MESIAEYTGSSIPVVIGDQVCIKLDGGLPCASREHNDSEQHKLSVTEAGLVSKILLITSKSLRDHFPLSVTVQVMRVSHSAGK